MDVNAIESAWGSGVKRSSRGSAFVAKFENRLPAACTCLSHVANGGVSSLWRILAAVDGRGRELLRTQSVAHRRRPPAHERFDAYRNYGAARCSAPYRGPSCTGTQQGPGR
jgi:hypothetical protein